VTSKRKRISKVQRKKIYTKGEINILIDSTMHPLKKVHWAFSLLDEAMHMINEGDIEQSLYKFAKYSLPELVKRFLKKNGDESERA